MGSSGNETLMARKGGAANKQGSIFLPEMTLFRKDRFNDFLNALGDFFVIGERLHDRNLTREARRHSGADQISRVNQQACAHALPQPVLAQVAYLASQARKTDGVPRWK